MLMVLVRRFLLRRPKNDFCSGNFERPPASRSAGGKVGGKGPEGGQAGEEERGRVGTDGDNGGRKGSTRRSGYHSTLTCRCHADGGHLPRTTMRLCILTQGLRQTPIISFWPLSWRPTHPVTSAPLRPSPSLPPSCPSPCTCTCTCIPCCFLTLVGAFSDCSFRPWLRYPFPTTSQTRKD